MRAAVCCADGGEEELRPLLEQIGREWCLPVQLQWFDSCSDLLGRYRPGELDLVLLDGGAADCLTAGAELRKLDGELRCILLTRDNRSALLGYALHPEGLVRRPADYPGLRAAMARLRQLWQEELRSLPVTVNRVDISVPWADICYVEVSGRLLSVHGQYGTLETRMSMARAEELLRDAPFFRCHRSYLVNLFQVRVLTADAVILRDGSSLPVSEDRVKNAAECWRRFREENAVYFRGEAETAGEGIL